MAKIVIDVRDNNASGFAKSILGDVLAQLWSIIQPPLKPYARHREVWRRRVDNGRWVKVWNPER